MRDRPPTCVTGAVDNVSRASGPLARRLPDDLNCLAHMECKILDLPGVNPDERSHTLRGRAYVH